jgi:iron complex outermembrane receptor protein
MLKQVLVEAIAIASGSAAAAGLDDVMVLEPLLVTSPLSESDWLTLPMAVSATAAEDQPGEQLLSLDSLLAPIPGTVSGSVRLNRVRHH